MARSTDTISVRYCSHPDGHAPKDCPDLPSDPRIDRAQRDMADIAAVAAGNACWTFAPYPSKIERAATPENHLTYCGDCHYAMYAHFLNGEYIGHPNEPTARIIDGR